MAYPRYSKPPSEPARRCDPPKRGVYAVYQQHKDIVMADDTNKALLKEYQRLQTKLQMAAVMHTQIRPKTTCSALKQLSGLLMMNAEAFQQYMLVADSRAATGQRSISNRHAGGGFGLAAARHVACRTPHARRYHGKTQQSANSGYDPNVSRQEERKFGFYWYSALWRLLRTFYSNLDRVTGSGFWLDFRQFIARCRRSLDQRR